MAIFRFLNFHKDPTDTRRRVFYYPIKEEGEAVREAFKARKIEFKELIDPQKPEILYLSVSVEDFELANEINSSILGSFNRKFIPDRGARIFLLIIFGVGLALAMAGYLMSKFSKS